MGTPASASGGMPAVSGGNTADALTRKLRSLRFQGKEREVKQRAAELGVPYINLEGFPINPESVVLLSEEESRALGLVCFWYSIDDLRLGSINPESPAVQQKIMELSAAHHTTATLYLISLESLRIALSAYERAPRPYRSVSGVTLSEEELNRFGDRVGNLKDLAQELAAVTTTSAVSAVIAGALATRASDIHIEAAEQEMAVRYRIDGVLYPIATIARPVYEKMVARLKLLSSLKINVTDRPQDGRFTIRRQAGTVDVRVSTLPTAHGESIVMRLLRWSAEGVSFDELGLIGRSYDRLVVEMEKPNGMILSTGPTGAGKTTTLYAIITRLSKPQTKIVTLEDPIEYQLPGVNQSQIDEAQGFTFATGLRSMLRQDPNIIMVGEIRDLDTADIAANAALTGHLVLSTLHTNSAAGAIPRLLSLGLARFLIPPSLNAVIGQRLVRRLCQICKQPADIKAEWKARVDEAVAALPEADRPALKKTNVFYGAVGCDACQGIGYRGQVGLFEVLVLNKKMEDIILGDEVSERKIQELALADGMTTMFQDGIMKSMQGITSLEEVFRVTKE